LWITEHGSYCNFLQLIQTGAGAIAVALERSGAAHGTTVLLRRGRAELLVDQSKDGWNVFIDDLLD
jgi:hypothetical protein